MQCSWPLQLPWGGRLHRMHLWLNLRPGIIGEGERASHVSNCVQPKQEIHLAALPSNRIPLAADSEHVWGNTREGGKTLARYQFLKGWQMQSCPRETWRGPMLLPDQAANGHAPWSCRCLMLSHIWKFWNWITRTTSMDIHSARWAA